MDKNEITRGLAENWPMYSFSIACMQGLLSVDKQAVRLDCMMYGLKCLTAAEMDKASISQGNQVT